MEAYPVLPGALLCVLFISIRFLCFLQGVFALYKGATPPAVGWAAIDSVLLGSLHNYRLFLLRHDMTESHPVTGRPRLTLLGHGIAGLFAGLTRFVIRDVARLLLTVDFSIYFLS